MIFTGITFLFLMTDVSGVNVQGRVRVDPLTAHADVKGYITLAVSAPGNTM